MRTAVRWILLLLAWSGASAWAGCTASSTGLAFGAYEPLTFGAGLRSSESTGVATVTLACSGIVGGGSYSLALGPSPVGNSISPRYLANSAGGPNMAFDVYRDPAYTSIWGDGGTGALVTGTLPAGDSTRSHTAYGRVPPGQSTLRPGSFSGSLVITVTYDP